MRFRVLDDISRLLEVAGPNFLALHHTRAILLQRCWTLKSFYAKSVENRGHQEREGAGAALVDNKVYVIGGAKSPGFTNRAVDQAATK